MQIDVFSLLPSAFPPYLELSIIKRAMENGLLTVNVHDIRAYTTDKHHVTDDAPYGGGGGMVMKPEPVFRAVEMILGAPPVCPVILMTPQGRVLDQATVQDLAKHPHIAVLCGRYEGVDERIRQHLVTDEISIGDYVLTGGELPALVLIDAVARLLPGALGDPDGALDDSHATGLLEYPHYTRPVEFRGWQVPEVLVSGNHAQIARWRRQQSLARTLGKRPDMLENAHLTQAERDLIEEMKSTMNDEEREE
ncbi:MAG: tRNA (guanosine(37)-N1)-methyltransferase TrmD [Anaerolineae bacterium]|jgi:tRNA (guanine37-N1)-methyltransferase|nr:tRNA (guanosine(37)-N1)-methyltransferase TrmD [Anaerolineae bacterium]